MRDKTSTGTAVIFSHPHLAIFLKRSKVIYNPRLARVYCVFYCMHVVKHIKITKLLFYSEEKISIIWHDEPYHLVKIKFYNNDSVLLCKLFVYRERKVCTLEVISITITKLSKWKCHYQVDIVQEIEVEWNTNKQTNNPTT